MAVINQIKLGSSGTTYDVNDKRVTTTAVTTATHVLTADSGVTSIAPITITNLASVLGAVEAVAVADTTEYADVTSLFTAPANN